MKNVVYFKDGSIGFNDSPIIKTQKKLDSGFYKVKCNKNMFGSSTSVSVLDLKLPTSAISFARKIADFKYLDLLFSDKSKEIHKDLNIKRKVGYLFHGKQGSGKTTTMQALASIVVKKYNACAFVVSDAVSFDACFSLIKKLRRKSDFLAVVIWDECEEGMYENESEIKSMLDGSDALDNSVILCATNYIDKIPETIKDRPSRFKYVKDISCIEEEEIVFQVLSNMNKSLTNPLSDKVIRGMTPKCTNKTVDEIKTEFTDECFKSINLILES